MGISCEKDRAAIMLAVENYLAEVKLNESTQSPVTPSAPLEEASTSSQDYNFIQSINMTECVICLDSQVSKISCIYIYDKLYTFSLCILKLSLNRTTIMVSDLKYKRTGHL